MPFVDIYTVMASRILVAFDESEHSRRALEHAIEEFPDADVTVLTVIEEVGSFNDTDDLCPEDDDGPFSELAEERLAEAEAVADEYGVSIRTDCEVGPPSEKIPAYAESEGFDHVVVGTHSRTGISRLVVGSVSETVAREVSTPVTTVE